jgi:hypothetical protein
MPSQPYSSLRNTSASQGGGRSSIERRETHKESVADRNAGIPKYRDGQTRSYSKFSDGQTHEYPKYRDR